jgi:NAD(P)-dependent dehydrogenase (short-subunit alcohol dehydrogenase family)
VDDLAAAIEVAREFGGVDAMVNNAGIYTKTRFLDVDPDEFDDVAAVNARGVYFGTQLAARDMIERDDPGVVVNTTSDTQGRASWDHAHYAATKGAARMVTRSAALELAPHGIRVNAVAPGPVATEIREGWAAEADSIAEAKAGEATPTLPLRAATPDELPGAYLFLASDAASYVTGETVWVDGGGHVD